MEESGNFLQFEVVYKDEHLLELAVSVSNTGFRGSSRGYTTADRLRQLSTVLEGFPKDNRPLLFELAGSLDERQLRMSFCRVSPGGYVGVQVQLAEEGPADQPSTLSTQLVVEPSAIDIFRQFLITLADDQQGTAKLMAI